MEYFTKYFTQFIIFKYNLPGDFMQEYRNFNIVPINQAYYYELLMQNIQSLKTAYPFLETGNIGYSVLGKQLPYIRIGIGSKKIMYNAGMHANEWITCVLLMKFVENFCKSYVMNGNIYGKNAQSLFNKVSLYILPMMNPDGIDLVNGRVDKSSSIYNNYLAISNNFPNVPFPSGWKANFNGVDLNLQFPAGWLEARRIKFEQGYTKPASRDFVGNGPLTEPESLAIYNFTLENNFALTISYHTQGKEIYCNFQNINPPNGYEIGKIFANISGYSLTNVPYNSSFAGYKDWFIQNYNRPGYTIEAGIGENPLPIYQFEQIYYDNEGILVYGMSI